jgi:iron complex outermembrane receptor protein
VAACLLTVASGLAAEPPPTGTGSDPGALSGRVLVAGGGSGDALPGVELRLDDGEPATSDPSTLSGPDGRYEFPELAPRRYLVKVASSGFEPYQQPVEVPAGAGVEHDIELEASFSGTVTVTATRSERRTEEVPAAVSVVGREQLEQTPMTNIRDALEGMPSTLIGAKNQGYDARLMIRGAGLKARYGIREIMVLLNGVPITDPDSFTRLDFVDTQLVDRVEVVRGPNSTLWGINATGGTVNVITRGPSSRWGGSARADVGSFGASAFQLNYSGGLGDKHFFSVDVSRRQADNDWRPHNEFDTTQVTVQPWINLGGDTMLETSISYTDANLQLPGWLIVSDSTGIDQWTPFLDTGEAEETADPWKDSARNSDILFFSSRLRTRLGDIRFEPLLFVNSWSHFHPVTGKINEADTVVGGIDAPATWDHGIGSLTGGITARWDLQDSDAYTYADVTTTPSGRILSTESDRPGELMERSEQFTSLYGIYAQESLRLGDRWLVDLGLRVDQIRFDISGNEWIAYDYSRGSYGPGAGVLDSVRNYTAVSPRVAAVFRLDDNLNLYGNISTGAQTPTFSELTTNPDLDLSTVLNYEVGLKGRYSSVTFDTAVYDATVLNEVVQVVEGSGYTEYVNAGETEKIGAELSVTATPWLGVSLGGGYAYSHYEYVDFSEPAYGRDVDRSGNRLPFIPEHQLSLFVAYLHRTGFSGRISANSWGSYFVDNANSETYEGYSLVTDLALGFTGKRFEAMLMFTNLFDDRYAIEVQKDLYGKLRYAPAAPRSVRARVTFRF